MKSFKRSVSAISPVLAVLMMIAVAIAGSLLVWAWVTGYIQFTTEKSEQAILIQSIANTTTGDPAAGMPDLSVFVQNVGEGPVQLDPTECLYVDGVLMSGYTINPPDGVVAAGNTATITVPGGGKGLADKVTVKVTTVLGQFSEKSGYPFQGGGIGGGGVTPPPTVDRVYTSTTGFSGVQEGDLLVVIANTRTGTAWTTGTLTASATGYTNGGEIASYRDDDSDRRAVVVLTKVAIGGESGPVTVTWTGTNTNTYATFYQVFRGATTYTVGDSDVVDNGGNPSAETTALPALSVSGSSTANVLTIGAGVWRDSPGTVSMTNLDGQYGNNFNDCYSYSEYSYGDAITDTTITWTTAQLASGLLVQFECSD